jgi:hypothetical protein
MSQKGGFSCPPKGRSGMAGVDVNRTLWIVQCTS